MDNKPILWEKNAKIERKSLRPPKSLSQTQNDVAEDTVPVNDAQSSNRLKAMEEILAKSALKADAPEWFPPSLVNNHVAIPNYGVYTQPDSVETVRHSIQNRLHIHKNRSVNTAQHSHSSSANTYTQNAVNVPVQNNLFSSGSNGEHPDIKRLKQIVTTLTNDPGQFDNLLDIFMETIYPHLTDIMFLSYFTKFLVEQAISTSNFRYTAARLCGYIEQNSPSFRAELHLICKKKLDDKQVTHNLLLFIAELYIQLPHLEVYNKVLIDCMKHLVKCGGEANVKCICQALKLTGYSLERGNTNDLDEVFNQLNQIRAQLQGSALLLLDSVLKLRQTNWGYSLEDSTDSEHDYEEYNAESRVLYQHDGNLLSTEESAFIAAHEEYLSDDSNPDDLCDPEPEMDPEIQAAFREFVEYSYNNK